MAHHHHPVAPSQSISPSYKWAVLLNAGYVVIEMLAGAWTGSLSLLADAFHNLTDVGGLLIAWGAAWLAGWAATKTFSFGFGKATILAALANALTLIIGVGVVSWQAFQRLTLPTEIPALPVMLVALIGIGINMGTALLFRVESHHDLNAKGAFLHMLADAAVSGAVVLSAGLILLTRWHWLDAATALAVSALIGWMSWGLLRDALRLALDGVPAHINPSSVERWLRAQKNVRDVQELHIWPLSTQSAALSVRLLIDGSPDREFIHEMREELQEHFNLAHVVIEIEISA